MNKEDFDYILNLVLSSVPKMTEEQRETLNRLLYTQYRGDSLDVLPSCDCQKYRGVFNVGIMYLRNVIWPSINKH